MNRGHEMAEKKIIVVDDDESIRKTFFLMFKKNYRVLLAKDSEEALRDYKSCKFDLIIADLRLPRLNGLEMIGRFRKLGFRGEAILISGHPDCVSIEDLSQHAIGHFFSKPLDFQALTRSIEYLLQPNEARSQL
jgi:DNA-binding NtrC family response regulator